MKIGFSFNRGEGGPSLFMQKIKKSIMEQKLCKTSYFFDPTNTTNLFCNKRYYTPWNKSYFFRADGVYFDKRMDSDLRQKSNNVLLEGVKSSEGVIFQSEFSQKMYSAILKYEHSNSIIIPNGTDLKKIKSKASNREYLRNTFNIKKNAIVFISSASWRAHKRLRDIINVFQITQSRNPKLEMYLIIIGEHDEQIQANSNIISVGQIPNEKIYVYLSIADIYMFFSWLDTCPNSVVEAIASGIPVLCTDQGGTREIVEKTGGGIVAYGSDRPFDFDLTDLYHPPKPDYDVLAEKTEQLINNIDVYKNRIDTSTIDIDCTARKYVEFIRESIQRKVDQ